MLEINYRKLIVDPTKKKCVQMMTNRSIFSPPKGYPISTYSILIEQYPPLEMVLLGDVKKIYN
jgi:hypothetical protein